MSVCVGTRLYDAVCIVISKLQCILCGWLFDVSFICVRVRAFFEFFFACPLINSDILLQHSQVSLALKIV